MIVKKLSEWRETGGVLEVGGGLVFRFGKACAVLDRAVARVFLMGAEQFGPLLRAREGGMRWTPVGQECWRMAWGFFRRLAKYRSLASLLGHDRITNCLVPLYLGIVRWKSSRGTSL